MGVVSDLATLYSTRQNILEALVQPKSVQKSNRMSVTARILCSTSFFLAILCRSDPVSRVGSHFLMNVSFPSDDLLKHEAMYLRRQSTQERFRIKNHTLKVTVYYARRTNRMVGPYTFENEKSAESIIINCLKLTSDQKVNNNSHIILTSSRMELLLACHPHQFYFGRIFHAKENLRVFSAFMDWKMRSHNLARKITRPNLTTPFPLKVREGERVSDLFAQLVTKQKG